MKRLSSTWRYFDLWLAAAVIILTAYGILMIRSAITNTPAFVGFEIDQLRFGILGIIVMIILASIDYRILTSVHWLIYVAVLLTLIIVIVAGTLGNDARRWIQIGGFRFQPSELGRILIAITFAQFLAERLGRMRHFSNTIWSIIYIGVPVGLIFLQPDLGMSILFLVIWFAMLVIAGLPLTHFVALGVAGLAGIAAIIPFLADYQRERILAFTDPDAVPDQAFNILQSEIAVGSGGWFGKGYFQGTQSQLGFLRVQHTDFIFSMITEEMGLVFGSLLVLGLLGFILWRILRVAIITPDPAGKFICVGIAANLFFQTTVNVGMNVQVVPVTGLTLPFVSYGGSSLVTLFIGIGFVQSVVMRHRKQDFG